MEALSYLIPFAVFIGIYALLYRRAERAGREPRVRWGWLLAIVGVAVVALIAGAVL